MKLVACNIGGIPAIDTNHSDSLGKREIGNIVETLTPFMGIPGVWWLHWDF